MCDDTVRVALRIRPLVESELAKGCQVCLDTVPGEQQVRISNTDKAFTYNYVFPPYVGQEDFYNTAIKRLLDNTFQGYNVTILAYGQTGSGKTYSMGTNYTGVEEKGIIPRIVCDIFKTIESKTDWSFKVAVSFMELYQEQLYDLLSDKQKSQSIVDIREDSKSIKIVGVTEKEVANAKETLECLTQGSMGRVTGATAMNAHSSRSHAIFTLCISQQKRDDPNTAIVAKFHLVDLAGSERSKKTQATGERFKEGVNINKGLLALGNVISQLGDGAPGTYIGYRDSKLTRLLQDSLGGNSMTLMVACVSPADYNLDETLSTLRYADRARKIKNKPIVNQDPKVAEINRLNKLIQELRLALMNQELGVTCPKEHEALEEKYRLLQQKLRDMTEKLNSNLEEFVVMHERAEMAEQAREKIRLALALLLDEFSQVLQDFSTCPDIDDEQCNKLKAMYDKMLDIQNDERKASEQLLNHEISNSKNCGAHMAENVEECVRAEASSNGVEDSLDYFDKKEEEHTLRQAERNNEVQNINKELALKESLVSELLKSVTQQTAESNRNVVEMEQEIKRLHAEKEEHLQVVHTHNISSKLAETRRKKVQELEKRIAELTRKCVEQNKIIKGKEKQDQKIKTLSREIQLLKETRVKLIRQMRNDANNFTKWKQFKEKEINKLKAQDRKRDCEMVRMKIEHNKQENVFKRKMEEAFAVNKRLKGALEMQKKAMQRQDKKAANNREEIKTWVAQELEVLTATVEMDYSLEKLMQDRASWVHQLEQLEKSNGNPDEGELATITEFIQLRNAQIADLQQKILESDQETRSSTRWNVIRTTADAKVGLETVFQIVTQDRKQQCYKYDQLKEKNQDLEVRLEEYEKRLEKYEKRLKECGRVNTISSSDTSSSDAETKSLTKSKRQVLENNLNRANKPLPKKRRGEGSTEVIDENAYLSPDESSMIEDDIDKDPDWKKTPLYNRIQKMQNKSKLSIQRLTFKFEPNGSLIRCACKTKCATRICTCRKNGVACADCGCDAVQCQNKDPQNSHASLFSDEKKNEVTQMGLEKLTDHIF
ncbi:PREDICTED: chromosome-associated kinesin KIF4 [Vollenhovia emeryi]|uniref:chromosome-associated kinesin KIF4 n=1 Tax=Vollenhovia emeryi TaxID=411798 RepID=UPI0005F52EC5|nr:PREDICTED: chromosome-associated kinesin KIF4 [Vollenhovia emeryi]XP_011865379.1 PREDICTED: chromosome-associated kinesin KIF4 [Vollenhovia emeryi]XP_011865380.1 PREDICTED: chromosome-associated kinesin KIF4 [Vollenhovia emeryi]XP_011865381.1 PREDICTED: chromosome-associated kinesin KIF4 [Vollenhovia emeryi]XP_011865382.1 PREDICTED: chromosome-associated kinesin KIF4 [Vollenhovia emeryi]